MHAPIYSGAIMLSVGFSAALQAQETQELPDITVESEAAHETGYRVDLETAPVTTPDSASLLRRTPGANVNRNGPLTGLPQYRGMFGDRVNVQVNGIHITSGGPNGMDPAISYVPRGQLGSFKVIRGIAPVSSGVESIGGTVILDTKTSEFNDSNELQPGFDFSTGGASVDESYSVNAMATLANRDHRMHLYGSRENGGNIEFPGGKIRPSKHERNNYGAGYGFRFGDHEISFNARRNRTDETGTPSLPMDILFIDTDTYELEYKGNVANYGLHGKVYKTDVNHDMANFVLRDPPAPTRTRMNQTGSNGLGYRADISIPLGSGTLMVGSDGHFSEHRATVIDPVNNPNFRVVNFNDVERDAYGFFSEWQGQVMTTLDLEFGVRYTRVNSDAGKVSHFMAGMNPNIATLQNRFNNADRSKTDNNFDIVGKLDYAMNSDLKLLFEAGLKSRAPSYQQRYLWVPLQATNGLADGNNYVGDINLDSERAYEVDFGADWRRTGMYAEPRVFYRFVDDYIQGTPATDPAVITVSTANGDATPLKWDNVDAKFYGFDMAFGTTFGNYWSVDGIISYVRGERDDINDDLYRIAPLNGRVSLNYRRSNWWGTAEAVAYDKQNKVSKTNNETKTDSYALLNLTAGFSPARNLNFTLGVENVFNKEYEDHLSGINRVANSDVSVGKRVPGSGRGVFGNLSYQFR